MHATGGSIFKRGDFLFQIRLIPFQLLSILRIAVSSAQPRAPAPLFSEKPESISQPRSGYISYRKSKSFAVNLILKIELKGLNQIRLRLFRSRALAGNVRIEAERRVGVCITVNDDSELHISSLRATRLDGDRRSRHLSPLGNLDRRRSRFGD